MFVWSASTILKQFHKYLPEINEQVSRLKDAIGSANQQEAIDTFYQNCPSISIDYGIMEPSKDVFVVPGSFGWNDVGSWKAIYDLWPKDENGNVVQADVTALTDANKNLIQSSSGKMIALAGVDNLAVVETDEAILVCDLNKAQKVKEIVNKLQENEEGQKFL